MAQGVPKYRLPLVFTVVERMNKQTREHDAFMSMAYSEVHGNQFELHAKLRAHVVLRTSYYNEFLSKFDTMSLNTDTYRGNMVGVFACALRRAGLSMPALCTIVQHVRVSHIRKQSAYKDFARECAGSLEGSALNSARMCVCEFVGGQEWCWWHVPPD